MTYDEESWLFDTLDQMAREIHQNNLMLKDLCNVVNVYLARHNQENEDDFGRNVLANLISGTLDLSKFRK